jgi:hypothetical protein
MQPFSARDSAIEPAAFTRNSLICTVVYELGAAATVTMIDTEKLAP